MGEKFMAIIYEKRTQFNLVEQLSDFKTANFKTIKHKISRIREFNEKSQKIKQLPNQMLTSPNEKTNKNQLILRKMSTDYKGLIETIKSPKPTNTADKFFTFVYDEVIDYLGNQAKLKEVSKPKKPRNSLRSSVLQDEEEFYAMDRLLSPHNQSPLDSSTKKDDSKLLRNIKIKKSKKNLKSSRSISPATVNLLNFVD